MYVCDYDGTHLATHRREMAALYPGTNVHARQFDAADEDAVREVVDHAVRTYGRLDVFFANAGVSGGLKLYTEIETKEFEAVLRTNVLGWVCRLPRLTREAHC